MKSHSPQRCVVLASSNQGKLRELQTLLARAGVAVHAPSEWHMPEVPEPYDTFLENALFKARQASAETGWPALADDSGLCVPALAGAPGVRSARFAASPERPRPDDAANNERLVRAVQDISDSKAYFYCVLVWVRYPKDPQPLIAEGVWWGRILTVPRGQEGFGYDPHFFLPEYGCTSAELAPEVKNQVSHRGQALRVLLARLPAWLDGA